MKGNLVAVISNGTAVLGLGDIGALAGKPVMEGKGLLFKVFSDVDVFDIEVNEKDIDKIVDIVKAISPTFGGINLEDIKAPECFEIEKRLIEELDIPVFHDDQHGTAIISGAGLMNALELVGKKMEDVKIVINGAGAAAISCSRLYIALGVKRENIVMLDSKGVLNKKRKDLNKYKMEFVTDRDISTLEEAVKDADVFLGLSVGGVMSKEMVKTMAPKPIVFAMANPDPEISYEDAIEARDDIIMATGRSDYPNQVNNVLGFPFIFRGALDVRATIINKEMKIAASYALAELAKEPVPETVIKAYDVKSIVFGKEYIIPKPLDPRLISRVAPAVAKAAIETGVARKKITDWDAYCQELDKRLGYENVLLRNIQNMACNDPKQIVFAEGDNPRILKAVQTVVHEGIAKPILLGNKKKIADLINENALDLHDVPVIDYQSLEESGRREKFAELIFKKRRRKGITYDEALESVQNRNYFGVMMVESGEADAFISGFSSKYADTIRPAIQLVGTDSALKHIAGMYIVNTKKQTFFFSDTTINFELTAQTLVDTTLITAEKVRQFGIEPKIALVSYSNFGAFRYGSPGMVREAVEILHRDYPDLIVDGEMQANFAFNKKLRKSKFPFSKLAETDVNTIIFPDLNSGNIAYKMMQEIGNAQVIGPVLMGIRKSIHILQLESSEKEIVNMAAIACVDAQSRNEVNTFSNISGKNEVKLLIHQIVREDALLFFGFADKHEREIFRMLISVSGIGANTARLMLSSLSPSELSKAIMEADINLLRSIKGIGAKSAQRVVVDLKEKVGESDDVSDIFKEESNTLKEESLSALVMLGFSKASVRKVLDKILREERDITVEELVKKALKKL
jgi:malate dehydrogenase (oxaloacetate-decarboxylating)(NADP+)